MNPWLPIPDVTEPNWRWPWSKVDLPADAQFGELHRRFNTRLIPIQDPCAFHSDVRECADMSATQAEFYFKMRKRKIERVRDSLSSYKEAGLRASHKFKKASPFTMFIAPPSDPGTACSAARPTRRR